jgi:hypothetical protein
MANTSSAINNTISPLQLDPNSNTSSPPPDKTIPIKNRTFFFIFIFYLIQLGPYQELPKKAQEFK